MQDRITVKIGDTEHSLFMSFPLLTRCASVIGGIESLPALRLDAATQQVVTRVVLQKTLKAKAIEDIDLDELEMAVEDGSRILDWVEEHLSDFFVKALERVATLAETHGPKILEMSKRTEAVQNSMPSASGTKA